MLGQGIPAERLIEVLYLAKKFYLEELKQESITRMESLIGPHNVFRFLDAGLLEEVKKL